MKSQVIILLVFVVQFSMGQTEMTSKTEVIKHADKIMNHFGKAEFKEAFTELRKHYLLPEEDFQSIKTVTITNLKKAQESFGDVIGEVFIKEENIENIALRRNYLVKYENILLRFQIVYYKSSQNWQVNSFKWDDEFEVFFK
ncbi:MAG: hypothetical protein WBG46_03225 [Nonlabens sp.]